MPTTDPLTLAAAAVVCVLACARLTRLLIHDGWPPAIWARAKWVTLTRAGPWADLATCPWCLSPYLVAASLTWAWATDLHWTWWAFHLWLALSYLVPMIVVRDEPPEQ